MMIKNFDYNDVDINNDDTVMIILRINYNDDTLMIIFILMIIMQR